jgi:hypothetical protein
MDVGLTLVPRPHRVAQSARLVEDLGFASLMALLFARAEVT